MYTHTTLHGEKVVLYQQHRSTSLVGTNLLDNNVIESVTRIIQTMYDVWIIRVSVSMERCHWVKI